MTDHVIDAIDAALLAWDTSADAMRCSYADTLPPVEERDAQRPSTGGSDVSHWEERGWTIDWGENAVGDLYRSVLLYGNVYLDPETGRVIPPGSWHDPPNLAGIAPLSGWYDALTLARPVVRPDHLRVSYSGARVTYAILDEAVDPPEQETARERALKARQQRHTGPPQSPHRHRGLSSTRH